MKAPSETVLLYNLSSSEKGKKIKGVCLRMGIRIKEIPPEQFLQPLGVVANLPGFEAIEGKETTQEPFSDEMLVMKNFTSRRMDDFFNQMRKAGAAPIALKAVMTNQNTQWNSFQLREELLREHEAMNKGEAAHQPGHPVSDVKERG